MIQDGQALVPENTRAEAELPVPVPDQESEGVLGGQVDVRHIALVVLALLAVLYTLRLAAAFFLPIVLAILLNLLLSPTVRWLRNHLRIPVPLGAGVVIIVLLGLVGFGATRLAPAASAWIARAPASIGTLKQRIQPLRRPMEQVNKAAEQVEQATDMDKKTQQVEIKGPGLSQQVFGGTTALLGSAMIVIFLTYFLLASGELFLQKLVGVLPQLKDKKTAVRIVRETEAQVSVYLVVTTLINLGVGVATGVALALVGMPNAVLWGVIAAVLNFVPYVGGLVNTVILALAAFLTFDDTGRALMVPFVFTAINILEGNLITPWILGRRMRLNTVAVFVGLIFWWYLWGVTGAILAVPIMASIKIACDHIGPLAPIGEFLAE
ncbi:MAG TPA: AI-2E family transporter [Gemmatimonadales bacterium]|nr:AI-2E family transporter [Gemmatimonadales bacterium]